MGEGGYETHGESGGHDRSGIHNPSVEEMGRRKGGRTRKERKRTKTSYRRPKRAKRTNHKLPTVNLQAIQDRRLHLGYIRETAPRIK